MLPIAIDAMGGDRGPAEIVAGARRAAEELGVPVLLVGRPDALGDTGGLEVLVASEVIAMGDDVATAVRRKKDASVVRACEAVRDGRASAMVSAGNTGAAMGSALLRMGRLPSVSRPAIATPLPVPGSTPTVLLDAGANADCQPEWLVQFAQMGAAFATGRYGIERPRVGLLSIGEEASKGTGVVKEAHSILKAPETLQGSGGRFIGNVVLKTLEGAMKFMRNAVFGIMTSTPDAIKASEAIFPLLLPLAKQMDPDSYGGALLLGVDGVCIISHGSSSPGAIVNALGVARDMVEADLVDRLRRSVKA